MDIRVLGHLEASIDDHPVALGGAKQRAVLAMLGLEANRAVTADRLIEGLWGEQPPASAAKMVQNYVWRLRTAFADAGGAEIVTRGRAYELQIDREHVDACRLERLVAEAARAAESGEPAGAAREALALFRGDPLADVADEPFADGEIRRLEGLRLTAEELAIEADLAAGRHQEIVSEIEALLAEQPLRERLHAARMLALYRCGRQAEALEAFREARRSLVDEIGVEPGVELRRLHDAILRQDTALDAEPATAELPRELDSAGAPPLIGRDAELHRLQARWQRATAGAGALVTVVGAYGMGKTRVAAEIAGTAHREAATVLYAAGTGPPEAALAVIGQARELRRRTLVVIDDADRAPAAVRSALHALGPALSHAPLLVLATGLQAAALARLDPAEALVLEPLDAGSVRSIAGFYAPAGDDDAVPVETLLATSRGVPRRIHEAASAWARQEATRRVDVAAGRAAAGRSEASALEHELAGNVEDLQSARERAGLVSGDAGDARAPVVCPYKGLASYDAVDAEHFFGRERLVAELVARLVGAPLLAIVGPSGSGKSSVVRAGLLPALAGGVLPGSELWTQAVIRPGARPVEELRRATRKLSRERRGVLAVDQFEELFTACADEAERAEFVAALVRAAGEHTVVVLAVRADFYGRCAAYPALSRLAGANHVLVGPMSRDELHRVIERPAQRAGLTVEPELAEALLQDVEGQPGALPLLSTALLELWRERDGRRLRLAAYARSGGVQGAVARLAEAAYVALEPRRRATARALLLRLSDEREDGTVVRRRIALAELDAGNRADVRAVVDELTDRRLLTVSDGAVEVAHEALLREWPRLRAWLDEDAEGRRLHRRIGEAARAWEADGRDPAGLIRGARLASALDWASVHAPELTQLERAFLVESRKAGGRAQRRLRMVLAGVAALLIVAVIAGAVALHQRGRARSEATAAAAQGLGAQALADSDLARSLLLARQALALDDTKQTRGDLLAALLKSPAAISVVRDRGNRLLALDLSPDGRTLAVVDDQAELSVLDTASRRPLTRPRTIRGFAPGLAPFDALRFSDDGTRLAIGGGSPAVIDPLGGRDAVPLRTSWFVTSERFSADGRTLYATLGGFGTSIDAVQAFDATSGEPIGRPRPWQGRDDTATLMVARDGRHVVTTAERGPIVIRDARTLRPLESFGEGAAPAALSADDRTLLLGGTDGTVRFVDLVTRRSRIAAERHSGPVILAAFSADGRTAVTAGEENRVFVWDVKRAAVRETLEGNEAKITGLVISRDGDTLYTSALDGKIIAWDLAGDRRLGRPFSIGQDDAVPGLGGSINDALSPDGRMLAVAHQSGYVTLVDTRTLARVKEFRAVPRGPVRGLAFVPGSGLLAVGGDHGYLALVDPGRGAVVQRLPGLHGREVTVSFSADGRVMAATALGEDVLLWRLRAGRPTGPSRNYARSFGTSTASLSPDGRTLAVVGPAGIEAVDVATLHSRAIPPGADTVIFLARFTPDSRYLVGGSIDGWTRLWSVKTWRPASPRLGGHTGEIVDESVSPDGRTLATGSTDGTVRLYDMHTWRPLGAPLPAVANRPAIPRFTPDGKYLLVLTDTGHAYRWDVRAASLARHACSVAGRTLTRAEWAAALPGREYAPACTG